MIRSEALHEVPFELATVHDETLRERSSDNWLGIGARELTIGTLTTSAVVHAVLVPQHLEEEPFLGISFALAALAAVLVGVLLTRPGFTWAPYLAAALFASLLVAYPVVHLINGEPVQALDIGTKVIEAVGLLAALRARHDDELGFAPVAVIAGVFLALLMVSVSGGHHHAHGGGAGPAHHHH
jgi:hypothetical protein